MNAAPGFRPIRGLFRLVRTLFLLACVLIAAFAVAGYATGWVKIEHNREQEKATIEIETGQVKQAAETVVEKSRRLVDDAAKGLQHNGQQSDTANPPQAPESR